MITGHNICDKNTTPYTTVHLYFIFILFFYSFPSNSDALFFSIARTTILSLSFPATTPCATVSATLAHPFRPPCPRLFPSLRIRRQQPVLVGKSDLFSLFFADSNLIYRTRRGVEVRAEGGWDKTAWWWNDERRSGGMMRKFREKELEANYKNTLSIAVEKSIMPFHFGGNYEFAIGVVFVSKIMCLVITAEIKYRHNGSILQSKIPHI
ncbi:hypothetical protein MtrunA17_Chr4g0053971 [Medicago truncatula]|uniref:Transmembrane protein n=1 Tax=Medicago truncatula TaxID=3880 RepID=A0A396IJE2_MEDTR|nr:hypothetical protein MtrunA17_Chr4g0053971 [Medicago truncatula]